MFRNYKNCKISLNGLEAIASNVQLSIRNELAPIYEVEKRHSFDYAPNRGIGGSLSITYYLTGADPLKSYLSYDESPIISGNFAGLYFTSGYLKSYNLNCSPNAPVQASAEIMFFDELKGVFQSTNYIAEDHNILNFADVTLEHSNNTIGSITNARSINFSYSAEINPVYNIGEILPQRLLF